MDPAITLQLACRLSRRIFAGSRVDNMNPVGPAGELAAEILLIAAARSGIDNDRPPLSGSAQAKTLAPEASPSVLYGFLDEPDLIPGNVPGVLCKDMGKPSKAVLRSSRASERGKP
jgi:hypothetical protein